jgi:teichoic acid ribitol-phosphate primase
VRDLVVLLRIWLVRIGFGLGSLRPVRRRVVLATSHADALGGNLAAIRDGIARDAPDVDVTTLAHRSTAGAWARLSGALQGLRAGVHLATASLFVVDDYFFPIYAIRPRRGTRIVQAWHASGALKRFGYSLSGKTYGASAALLRHVRIHSNYDLCLVSSRRVAPAYAEAFGLPLDRFSAELGIPRTDVLFDPDWRTAQAASVRRRYGIADGTAVILYAPTFRGDEIGRARDPGLLDLETMRAILGDDHVVLVRLHPFVRDGVRIGPELEGFAIDASDHPDIHALMLVSDHLVTDYSSAIFEYALLEKPMSFFAPDLDAYERERGFYLDYRTDLPGPIFEDTEALAAHLRSGAFDLERVARFRDASFDVADGHAAQRFVERVVLPATAGPAA